MASQYLQSITVLRAASVADLNAAESAGEAQHNAIVYVKQNGRDVPYTWSGTAWVKAGYLVSLDPAAPYDMQTGGNLAFDSSSLATSAQGAKADTALQSSDIASKVNTSDSRLSDARTPTAHASTHAGGSDPLTLSEAQITNLTADLAAKAPATRSLSTTAPLSGGGDLSANRTLAIAKATGSVDGYLAAADFTTFNGKQGALSFGNLTGANGIGVTGGTGAVIGTGVALSLSSVPNSALANSSVTVNGTANQINGGGSVSLGGTLTLSLTALIARTVQSVTISASTYTLQPTAEIVLITCTVSTSTVTLSETGAVTGSIVLIVNVGSNPVIIQDQTGVSETSGNFTVGANDSISFVYTGDRFIEVGRSNN